MIRAIRDFSSVELAIAEGISRSLPYKQIAALPEVRLSVHTVRFYVMRMAAALEMSGAAPNDDNLDPREKVWLWIKHREWRERREHEQKSA